MYRISKYLSGIYLVEFEISYDLAMTFLRCQEYYESLNDNIRGKQFTILQYIDWYSVEVNGYGSFSYPSDWAGFNIPSTIVEEVNTLGILDPNHYDERMLKIHSEIKSMHGEGNFYIIGTVHEDSQTTKHEVAHGLYYTNESYRSEVNSIWNDFTDESKTVFRDYLYEAGYPEKVHIDEAQAYLSTDSFHINDEISEKSIKFKQLFKRYNLVS